MAVTVVDKIVGVSTSTKVDSDNVSPDPGVDRPVSSSDNGKYIYVVSTTPVTYTIPTGLPVGFICHFLQGDIGTVSFLAASGVTLGSDTGVFSSVNKYSVLHLFVPAPNVVFLSGSTGAFSV